MKVHDSIPSNPPKHIALLVAMLLPLTASVSQGAEEPPQYPLMHFTPEQKQQLMSSHQSAPQLSAPRQLTVNFPSSFSLLSRLPYVPAERDQGACGDCWQWAGTGVMEIAHDVQDSVHDRLSIQFINSCNSHMTCCAGGWLENLTIFYGEQGFAIPWTNNKAQFLSGNGTCSSAPCGNLATTPRYPIQSISPVTIPTHGIGQAQAIANIKAVLNQNKAIWFAFFMSTSDDWNQFFSFWFNQPETAVWPSFYCGKVPNGQAGHAVLCVGYNEDDPANRYWIMVNSWGTASGRRPNVVFRVSMDLNYDCADSNGFYSLYWETLDIQFGQAAAANDQFANRVLLSGPSASVTGSNMGATSEPGEPMHAGIYCGKSVWWTWTAPSTRAMNISTYGSSFDTLLGVYNGSSVSALTQVAGNDDCGGTLNSAVRFVSQAGTAYKIAVDGYYGASGTVQLNIAPAAPLRLRNPERLADGTCRIWVETADGTPIEPSHIPAIEVYSSPDAKLPMSAWTRLSGSLSSFEGRLRIDDPAGRNVPARFYRAIERP